jgi:hypothetical protein
MVVVRPGEARIVLTGQHLGGGPQGPKVLFGRADGGEPATVRIVAAAADRIEAAVTLPETAKPGPYLVVVETSEGAAVAVVSVEAAPPVVETIAPDRTGVPGNTVFRLQGKNLLGPGGRPPEVMVTRVGGGSVLAPQVLSAAADALQVRIATLPGTPPVAHLIVVRTPDGSSAALFRVVPVPTPMVSGIAPGEASPLQTVTVVVKGSGLRQATRVVFDNPGITALIVPGTSETELTLRVTVADKTPPGVYGFTVEGPGGFGPSDKVVFKVK